METAGGASVNLVAYWPPCSYEIGAVVLPAAASILLAAAGEVVNRVFSSGHLNHEVNDAALPGG
jgi:hypothetical protein